jgi:peptidoglycan/LPS O-acetylase OafA/YrhL
MPQLDGLRAFAVLGVVATHFGNSELSGYLGVRLFFVLSGFLITSLLLKSKTALECGETSLRQQLGSFYIRRFLRLYPALLVFVGLCVVFEGGPVRSTWMWHVSYMSNILFALRDQRWFHVALLWSLSVEEQFYFVWPILIFSISRSRLFRACYVAIAMGVLWRTMAWMLDFHATAADVLPFNALTTFGMGALLAVSISSSSSIGVERLKRIGRGVGLWAFVGLLALSAFKPGTGLQFVFLDVASASVFAWIILGAANGIGGFVGKTLSAPPIVYVGKISYGIYLYHIIVPDFVRWAFRSVGLRLPGSSVIQFVIFTLSTIAAASVSWFLMERPIARLRRYFRYRANVRTVVPWRDALPTEAVA